MLEKRNTTKAAIEQIILGGDLTSLTAVERVHYYLELCGYLGLDAVAHPFDYIKSKGKLSLYINAAGTAQLRKLHNISLKITNRETVDGVHIVTVMAVAANGRSEESSGMVSVTNLAGEDKCNAMLKAETKAKRRATLSVCGLGWTADTDSPIKAEFYDPPLNIVPPKLIGTKEEWHERDVWRSWNCVNDAIEWALTVCDRTRPELEQILKSIEPDNGKKAIAFYNYILNNFFKGKGKASD
jgi:hypothetical protein